MSEVHCPNCGYDLRDPEFGKQVRSERMEAKITQAAVAKAIGVTHGYVSQIENGDRPTPDIVIQEKWRKALAELAAANEEATA